MEHRSPASKCRIMLVQWGHEEVGPKIHLWMRMWCAKPVGATHHGRLHNAQATEWREGLDRPGRGHPDLAGIYQPGNMTIDERKKKKKYLSSADTLRSQPKCPYIAGVPSSEGSTFITRHGASFDKHVNTMYMYKYITVYSCTYIWYPGYSVLKMRTQYICM